jgi:hypothetical protein
MELNRNQFFTIGLVLLFLGIQFRMLDSFTLNEKATHFVATRVQGSGATASAVRGSSGRHVVRPPQWLGYAMLSIGSVLVLHAMAMPKPGGSGG